MRLLFRITILLLLISVSQGLTTDYRVSQYTIYEEYNTDTLELASIINAECGICDDSERDKTGSVVLNRVDSDIFPNNLLSVIAQEKQFSGYCSIHYHPSEKSIETARNLLNGVDRVGEILYFWNPAIAEDTTFTESMINRVTHKEKYHYYAK